MFKPSSLRGELLVRLLMPLLVVWIAGSVAGYYLAKSFAYVVYDRALYDTARALATLVKFDNNRVAVEIPQVALQLLRFDNFDEVFFQVRDHEGQIVAGDREMGLSEAMRSDFSEGVFYDGNVGHRLVRVSALALPVPGKEKQYVLVQVAETLNKRQNVAQEILVSILISQLILILIAAWVVWHGTARGLSPLVRIQQEIAQRSHRDFHALDVSAAPREIKPLLDSFNVLLARLGKALMAGQRFTTDAAHQLRTPLAGLKTQTDFALRQSDLPSMKNALRQLELSTGRVIRLANQLLALNRAEPDVARDVAFVALDLAWIARQHTMEWVPVALEKDIDLGFEGDAGAAPIQGDALLIGEVLANLIDNALRYTPSGGKVTVKVSGVPCPALSVEDNGPGVPHAERERVFERFHRVLGAPVGGSGLGLSIVKEIVELHKAEVTLAEGEGGRGARVCVIFPVASSPDASMPRSVTGGVSVKFTKSQQ